jgi:vacuolar-type H+-ATPase subunit H
MGLNDKIRQPAEVVNSLSESFNELLISGECALNEKRIQEVIEIEKQAAEAYNKAVKEAERIPAQADKDAKALVEKAHAEADTEAGELLAQSHPQEECDRILADMDKQVQNGETLAKRNLDRAVTYVISRVLGQE